MLRVLRVSRRSLLALFAMVVVGGCAADRLTGGSTGGVTEEVVVADVAPLTVGASRRLTAQIVRNGRDTVAVSDVVWTSENTSIATISDGNLLTAVGVGETYVVADDQKGKKGRGHIKVNGAAVSSVRVNPTALSLSPGKSASVAVEILDANGNPITGKSVTWASSDTMVVVVASGVVSARRTGTASIAASVDGVTGTAAVSVVDAAVASVSVTLNSSSIAVGQQTTAVAVLRDASNNVLTGRSIGWSSSNTAVATVDANGLVRGVAAGTASIVASSEGVTGGASVTVTPQTVASISLTPSVVSTSVGQSVSVSATLRDAAGNLVTGRQPAWASASTAIATVSATGTITGVATGSTTVTASIDGASAQVAVTVSAAGSPTVSVTPATASVVAGQTVQLSAAQRDASGNLMNTTFTWSTSNAAVATVSASGLVRGVASGTATIVARSAENLTASSTITVTPVPVASVTIAPTSLALVVGQSGSLAATCRDASGNPLTGRTVTWSSSATGIATVDVVGTVRGVAAGSATITANCEGRTATAAVTVTNVPVATVTLTPATATVSTGTTVQLTATLRDANGNTLTGRSVAWTTSNAAVATVSSTGLVSGIAAGTATITATSEGRSGTATITVQSPVIASVSVSPASVTLVPGGSSQLTATARDAGGAVISGVTYSWTSSNTVVAAVSSSGLVTAGSSGSATITVSAGGRSATSSITVSSGSTTAEPPPSANMLFSDNFDAATSAGQGYATRGVMSLITGRGNTGRAIRFSYSPASADNLIERNIPAAANFYFSYWYRASTGTDFTCGGRNPSGIKWLMLWRANGPRYTNGVGDLDNGGPGAPQTFLEFTTHDNSSTQQPNPFLQNVSKTPKFGTTNDGQWHRYTIHVVTGNGGYEQIWIDGVLVLDNRAQAYDHSAEGISMFQMPGLMVAGVSTGCDFTLDIDDIRIWAP